ncbi:hypothetical protein GQ55_2G249500 [Panicum hallii var. hallii]|uniref:Uncharacterized protein n=1 Tax=Panicum hallii var. hallii TaxID=1504633 RepID=A0A2T7ES30_9POAL|nr:hypothetical protein GQ55_2G249500 [Panicum hallii var. hallii]
MASASLLVGPGPKVLLSRFRRRAQWCFSPPSSATIRPPRFQLGRLFKFSVQTFQVQGWMRHGLVKAWDLRREDWTNLINDK